MVALRKEKTTVKRRSYKDVIILFEIHGIKGVEAAMSRAEITAAMVYKAAEVLKPRNAASSELLEAVAQKQEPRLKGQHRGRPSPTVGMGRPYCVQQVRNGPTFLRLPLTPLGAKRGERVAVKFEGDHIVVRKLIVPSSTT